METAFVYDRKRGCYMPDMSKKPDDFISILPKYAGDMDAMGDTTGDTTGDRDATSGMVCHTHPNYSGFRLGRKVINCPSCMALYKYNKDKGLKESRNNS